MSTATVNPTPAITEQAISYENVTYARVYVGEGDNLKYSVETEDKAKEIVEKYIAAKAEFDKNGGKEPEVVTAEYQTFKMPYAGTVDGINELVESDKEKVLLFNRGLSTKLRGKSTSLLKATDENGEFTFVLTEEPHDMTQYAGIETSRRSMSAVDKIGNLLQTLTPEQIATIRAMLS